MFPPFLDPGRLQWTASDSSQASRFRGR
uniref:Uncharacterized protein n=1 Tax=Arundo donax TaxID=35708 RepID=A0A0A9A409_ARUDO